MVARAPFLVLTAATFLAAVVAAALSYYVFERPILSLKNISLTRRRGGQRGLGARFADRCRRRSGTRRLSESAGRSMR